MDSLFLQSNFHYAFSKEGMNGAQNLIENIKHFRLRMDALPNLAETFSEPMEHEDFLSYLSFIHSANGRFVLSVLEEDNRLS